MREIKIGTHSFTNRESASLDKYLNEIGKIGLISAEEEVILSRKIKEGDSAALNRLINANLRFVVSVAKQYQNQGLTLGDLINEGNIGLSKAAGRFDETRGFKFISYAVWWIRQAIIMAIAEQSRVVRLPLNQIGRISKISKTTSKLEQELEREPTPKELADILEMSIDKVTDSISYAAHQFSLDAPFLHGEAQDNTLLEVLDNEDVTPDQGLVNESLNTELTNLLSRLKARDRTILILFFGLGTDLPLSLEEIGERMNLTRERVRQLKDGTLKQLRTRAQGDHLESYL